MHETYHSATQAKSWVAVYFVLLQPQKPQCILKSNKRTFLGFAAGIMAGVSYGLNPLFGKPLLDGGVPVLSMLFFRYAISALLLGGWMLLRKETFKATWKEFQLLIVLGILFAASSVTLFESYKFIPAGLATTLVYLYPIFVAVIMLFLKVYPTWQVWLSIAAAGRPIIKNAVSSTHQNLCRLKNKLAFYFGVRYIMITMRV